MPAQHKLKASLYVLLCVCLWGLIPVVAKLGQQGLDNHQFLFWSSLVSFLVLFISTLFTNNLRYIKAYTLKQSVYVFILGILGTYIYYLFLYLGYAKAKGLEVLVIQYTWPVMIVLLSLFLLKEKLTGIKIMALCLGFSGVLMVITKGNFSSIDVNNPKVILWVCAGAFSFALFSVLSKKMTQEPLGVTSLYFLSATIASFISMLYFSEFSLPASHEILPILVNGIFVNGFSYVFWLLALRSAQASFIAPFTFIAPILSAFYLIVFFGESFSAIYGVALLLVVCGGLLNSFSKR